MKTWALANQKGGTGKTTTSIHLAAALAALGKRVLLVDLDPQAHATLGVGRDPEQGLSVARVFRRESRLSDVVVTAPGGFHLAPSSLALGDFEELAQRIVGPERVLGQALTEVAERYDFTLIDCPPRADGVLTANAVRAADTALLVVETGAFALRGALQALEIFQALGRELGRELDRRIVATMFDRRTRLAAEILIAMQQRFGRAMFDTAIRRSVRLAEAAAFGTPVQVLAPSAPAVTDFEALAREVLAACDGAERAAARRAAAAPRGRGAQGARAGGPGAPLSRAGAATPVPDGPRSVPSPSRS